MLALSVRQPFAELILRGIKTDFGELSRAVEYRSRPTRIIGERFHIYAAKGSGVGCDKLTAGRVQGSGFRVQGSGKGKAWWRASGSFWRRSRLSPQ